MFHFTVNKIKYNKNMMDFMDKKIKYNKNYLEFYLFLKFLSFYLTN